MAGSTMLYPSSEVLERQVRDQVVRGLWRKGRACAADLANEVEPTLGVDEMLGVIERLRDEGVVRVAPPARGDERSYKAPYQTVYELAE